MPNGNDVFDVSDPLGQVLKHTRRNHKLHCSTIADADAIVQKFSSQTEAGAWPFLDRTGGASHLRKLRGPETGGSDRNVDPNLPSEIRLCGTCSRPPLACER